MIQWSMMNASTPDFPLKRPCSGSGSIRAKREMRAASSPAGRQIGGLQEIVSGVELADPFLPSRTTVRASASCPG
ncbi:hypothetical protein [Microvirga sp. M2]|uniref:hypothetical protein n=1 Tax=Microvirga sp. M2 TaxID=3073270 RepID=UPI0039C26F5F